VIGENFDRWEQRAIRKGERRGELKGMRQGEVTLLLKQLIAKFKSLPTSYRHKLENADLKTLDHWGLRLLSAASLEEVFEASMAEAIY